MIILWIAVIALIVWAVIRFTSHNQTTPGHTPLEIAKQRYARGELTRAEFEQVKKDLTG